jgi:DNA-directed RNA polymerase subunit L
MEPVLSSVNNNGNELNFTISNIEVGVANALRRVILSEIPSLVFRTTPHNLNKCNILENTCRLNNEIIKQRLSCIPIHISDLDIPWDNFEIEVKKVNNEFVPIVVTTGDFRIKDISTDKYLNESDTRKIFPPDNITGDYIDFVRLRSKLSESIRGESLHLTCKFDIGTAKEDGSFSAVSTCAYGNTPNKSLIDAKWKEHEATLIQEGIETDKLLMLKRDWMLIDGKRLFVDNSFDFRIETIGVYENLELVKMGCTIILDKITKFNKALTLNAVNIESSKTTVANSFDVTLENEDYTFGKVIEYILYTRFYKTGILSFCGFKKFHPHDSHSIIRIAFSHESEREIVTQHLILACQDATHVFETMSALF